LYGRSCAAALSYVSTCATLVKYLARVENRNGSKLLIHRDHTRRDLSLTELGGAGLVERRRATARPCRPERRAPRAAPPKRVPAATAPPRTAQPGAGRDPPARGRPRSPELPPPPCRARVYIRVLFASATPHDTDVVGPPRKNAKWRKDSHVRHFLNPDDYCGSVRADGVYTHYRRRHDPLLHGTNSRALRVDRLDRTINSYTCPARGGLEAPACTRDSRANS
jgi:hypothetical protein